MPVAVSTKAADQRPRALERAGKGMSASPYQASHKAFEEARAMGEETVHLVAGSQRMGDGALVIPGRAGSPHDRLGIADRLDDQSGAPCARGGGRGGSRRRTMALRHFPKRGRRVNPPSGSAKLKPFVQVQKKEKVYKTTRALSKWVRFAMGSPHTPWRDLVTVLGYPSVFPATTRGYKE